MISSIYLYIFKFHRNPSNSIENQSVKIVYLSVYLL